MIQLNLTSGPDRGASFRPEEPSFTIGRGRTNRVILLDPKVSARHAQIECRGEQYILRDLNSTNGMFVNEQLVREAVLKTGDHIRLGQSVLEVESIQVRLEGVSQIGRVSLSDAGAAAAGGSVRLRIAQPSPLPVLEPSADQTTLPSLVDAYRNLLAMYKVSSIIRSNIDLSKMLDDVLTQVFRNLRAERGVILLFDDETGELIPRAYRSREGDASDAEISISRTIVHEVVERREAVLTSDATLDERFHPSASVIEQHIRSAMCAPLSAAGQVLGIVYVDCRSEAGSFKKADLELLTAIAGEAGMAVENRILRDANIKAERLAAIGQTVAGLSHYIKNILSCMSAGSDIITRSINEEDVAGIRKGWGIVSRNERKISDLVLDMLNYSADRKPVRLECDLRNVIEDVVDIARPALEEAKIRPVLALDPRVPKILADATGLQRCLLNLLTNAMDALGGREGAVITISTSGEQDSVCIRVADNGPGVPPEMQRKIFDAFFTTKGDRGTGLGLAVVRKIIHEHAGEISVQTAHDGGAEFCLVLPIRPAEERVSKEH